MSSGLFEGYSNPLDFTTDPLEAARRRQLAMSMQLPDREGHGLGNLVSQGLSGIGYVGSTLDKAFGGRAVRAAVDALFGSGQHSGDIASIIPFSDTLGLTRPEDAVSGSQLLKNTTDYDPTSGNWVERNLVGPAVEIALDPSTWLGGVGALTHAGTIAKGQGALTKGLLPAIEAGQKTAFMGLTGPRVASAIRGVGEAASSANEAIRGIPGVGAAEDWLADAAERARAVGRGLFSAPHGFVPDPVIQASHAAIKFPGDEAAEVAARTTYNDLLQRRLALEAGGIDPAQLQRFLRQKAEDVPGHFYDPAFVATLPEEAHRLGEDIRRLGGMDPRSAEVAAGYASPELQDEIAYTLRQKNPELLQVVGDTTKDWLGRSRGMQYAKVQPRLEGLTGLPGGTIQIEDLLSQPGMTAEGWIGKEAATREIMRQNLGLDVGAQFSPLPGARMTEAAGKTAELLGGWDVSKYVDPVTGLRAPLFDPDVIRAAAMRSQRAGRAVASADTALDVIGKAASEAPAGTSGMTPILDVLGGLGLDTEQGYRRALAGIGVDPGAVAPGDVETLSQMLAGYSLPSETASGLTDMLQRYTTPHELGPVGRAIRGATEATKRGLYTVWPASHVRNLGSGEYQNLIDVGLIPESGTYQAMRKALSGGSIETGLAEYAGLPDAEQTKALLAEAYAHRIIGEPAGELAGRPSPPFSGNPIAPRPGIRQAVEQARQALTSGPWQVPWSEGRFDEVTGAMTRPAAAGVQLGQGINTRVEDLLRLSEYTHLRRQGWLPEAAAKQVFETHFDYAKGLSDFEKTWGKQAILFPTYSRFNIPKQVGLAITNPGKQMPLIRMTGAAGNEEGYVPQYMQSGLAIPMPSEDLEPGTQRYVSSLGLPFEEAFGRLKTGPSTLSTVQQTGQGFLSMLNPMFKTPLEWFSGTQLHTGRALQDLYPGQVQSLGGILPKDLTIALSEAIGASPASRIVNTLNRLVDERKMSPAGAVEHLLALTSGIRTTDVDTEKWRAIDERKALEALLEREPHIKKSVDYYAPKEQKPNLTPREIEEMGIFSEMKRRAREEAKQRLLRDVQSGGIR